VSIKAGTLARLCVNSLKSEMFFQLLVVLCSGLLCLSQQCQDEVYTNDLKYPSCKDILTKFPDTPSGFYVLTGSSEKVYCDMENKRCGSQGWTRVAYLNMSSPMSLCPENFHLYEVPIHSCGGQPNQCVKARYSTHGIIYSQVCGRMIGYQVGTTDAFGPYNTDHFINDTVDGILISYGSKREHVWAYVSGNQRMPTEAYRNYCPCASNKFNAKVPPFIGNDYYCDSGTDGEPTPGTFYEDPLWDGLGCKDPNVCCYSDSQPWFCKTLADPTSDAIDVYNCNNEASGEDTAVELIELYIR